LRNVILFNLRQPKHRKGKLSAHATWLEAFCPFCLRSHVSRCASITVRWT